MRVVLVMGFTLGPALFGAPAAAQDTEALRRELEQLRQQLTAWFGMARRHARRGAPA